MKIMNYNLHKKDNDQSIKKCIGIKMTQRQLHQINKTI